MAQEFNNLSRIVLIFCMISTMFKISYSSHFFGLDFAMDLIDNGTAGQIWVNFYWRLTWNANSTTSKIGIIQPLTYPLNYSPFAEIDMEESTSSCVQITRTDG